MNIHRVVKALKHFCPTMHNQFMNYSGSGMSMLTLDSIRDIRLYQNKSGYRFSVDALLLSSFVTMPRARRIADLGAGSGIIGLLLARRFPKARVMLVELQRSLARLAEKNTLLNGLQDRVTVVEADIRTALLQSSVDGLPSAFESQESSAEGRTSGDRRLSAGSFDLVVSNPPFRRPATGLLSAGDERAMARHELTLSLRDLAKAGSALLQHHGRFCIIHLPERLAEIAEVFREHSLALKRLRFVHSRVSSEAKMVLIEAVKEGRTGLKTERPLFIYNEDGTYTDEIEALYSAGL